MFVWFRALTLNHSCKEIRNILNIISEIEQETPFSAGGFFYIERSTLISIAGAILTYLIILVQFDSDESNINVPTEMGKSLKESF